MFLSAFLFCNWAPKDPYIASHPFLAVGGKDKREASGQSHYSRLSLYTVDCNSLRQSTGLNIQSTCLLISCFKVLHSVGLSSFRACQSTYNNGAVDCFQLQSTLWLAVDYVRFGQPTGSNLVQISRLLYGSVDWSFISCSNQLRHQSAGIGILACVLGQSTDGSW